MGTSMAGHLMEAGHPLTVYNRTKEKAAALLDKGAAWATTPAEAAARADVVITIVGCPLDVEELYIGPAGIVAAARAGTLLVDMTSSSPALARRIAKAAAERGLDALDAPVSGGDAGARNGTLSIMVGGSASAFAKAEAILGRMGKNVVHQGESGSGQHCKMSNQIIIASTMMGIMEALVYGMKAGLDLRVMLSSIGAGAASSWSLSNLVPRVLDGNFAPGFYVKHFIKDMGIALDSARESGLSLPGLEKAEALYRALACMDAAALTAAAEAAAAAGALPAGMAGSQVQNGGELGTQALFLLYAAGRA